jgi:hypothetical protein
MPLETVTEEEIQKRLRKLGKSDEEIDNLLDQYSDTMDSEYPNEDAISEILQKTARERVLRVRFNLPRDQYDALLNYFQESDMVVSSAPPQAKKLVQEAIKEFIDLLQ